MGNNSADSVQDYAELYAFRSGRKQRKLQSFEQKTVLNIYNRYYYYFFQLHQVSRKR